MPQAPVLMFLPYSILPLTLIGSYYGLIREEPIVVISSEANTILLHDRTIFV